MPPLTVNQVPNTVIPAPDPEVTKTGTTTLSETTASASAAAVSQTAASEPAAEPAQPTLSNAVEGEHRRIDTLLAHSAHKMPVLSGNLMKTVIHGFPRPPLFSKGHVFHNTVVEAAKHCDIASKNLACIPAKDLADMDLKPKGDAKYDAALETALQRLSGLEKKGDAGFLRACGFDAQDVASGRLSGLLKSLHTYKALQDFTSAQQNFASVLGKYAVRTGSNPELAQNLMTAASNRASEAINLAATLQLARANPGAAGDVRAGSEGATLAALNQGDIRLTEDKSVASQLSQVGLRMHGGHFAAPLEAGIREVAHHLDALEQSSHLTASAFRAEAGQVKTELETLKAQIAAVGDRTNDPHSLTLKRDVSLQQALIRQLDTLRTRFEAISGKTAAAATDAPSASDAPAAPQTANAAGTAAGTGHDPTILVAAKTLLPPIDAEALGGLAALLPKPFADQFESLTDALKNYDTARNALFSDLEKGNITQSAFESRAEAIIQNLRQEEPKLRTLDVMQNVARHADWTHAHVKNGFKCAVTGDETPFAALANISEGDATKLANKLHALYAKNDKGIAAASFLSGTAAVVRLPVIEAEIKEIGGMIGHQDMTFDPALVSAAFDKNVDAATLISAGLRRIPADQLELHAGDAALKESRVLGHGNFNTATLCTYEDGGVEFSRVFKPEMSARHSMTSMVISRLGYGASARVMQLNVASSAVADEIGCGNVIARSKIGTHNGQIGLFMEEAKGITVRTMNQRGLQGPMIQDALENRQLDTLRGNLLRELNHLEWADVLSGQVDRHRDNYLVDINTKTGDVKVTGIDNDGSFSARRVGIVKYNIEGLVDNDKLAKLKAENGVVDIRKLNDVQRLKVKKLLGLNQMSVPSHIDRPTYDKLMQIDRDRYAAKLSAYMDEDAVNAALARLDDAKAHAEALKNVHRLVDDWSSREVADEVVKSKSSAPLTGIFINGFFNRDFSSAFAVL